MPRRIYLGDSVYSEVERGMIKLYTDNGFGATNTIFLELEVYDALVRYVEKLKAETETVSKDEQETDEKS